MVSASKRIALSRARAKIDSDNYKGEDRRSVESAECNTIDDFIECSMDWRKKFDERTRATNDKVDVVVKKQDSIHTAIFAKTEDNEHGQVGLMVTAKNIDTHILAFCRIAKWSWRSFLALLSVATAALALGKTAGWWL